MHVLLVDDSKAMRMLIARTLRHLSAPIASLSEATDGREALAMARTRRFDLIICDWSMPTMNGLELLHALRREGVRTRFGFVTAVVTPEMRVIAFEAGASFFVSKPFTADAMQSAMQLL